MYEFLRRTFTSSFTVYILRPNRPESLRATLASGFAIGKDSRS